jgi:hypothetical protein
MVGIRGLSRLPLDPRFAGSNPAEDNGLFRAIKIHSTTSFGGEIKSSAPCRKILRHVIKISAEYDRDTTSAKYKNISRQLPASLVGVSAATRDK